MRRAAQLIARETFSMAHRLTKSYTRIPVPFTRWSAPEEKGRFYILDFFMHVLACFGARTANWLASDVFSLTCFPGEL